MSGWGKGGKGLGKGGAKRHRKILRYNIQGYHKTGYPQIGFEEVVPSVSLVWFTKRLDASWKFSWKISSGILRRTLNTRNVRPLPLWRSCMLWNDRAVCLISNTLPQLKQSSLQPSTVVHHRHLLQTTCYNHHLLLLLLLISREENRNRNRLRTPGEVEKSEGPSALQPTTSYILCCMLCTLCCRGVYVVLSFCVVLSCVVLCCYCVVVVVLLCCCCVVMCCRLWCCFVVVMLCCRFAVLRCCLVVLQT